MSTLAAFPDRGSLFTYDRTRGRLQSGAATWHPVQLSEEHALRAAATGSMVIEGPAGQLIRLQYERRIEHPDGNWTWIGRPVGTGQGNRAILTFGEKAAFGSIPYGNDAPLQLTTAAGRNWLVETDKQLASNEASEGGKTDEPDFLVPVKYPNSDNATRTAMAAGGKALATSAVVPKAAATASTTVDVVLGYTTGFATRLGGASQATTRLTFLVDLTNQAYVDSQVTGQIRLVRAIQVNYPDATSNQATLFELSGVTCTAANGSSLRLPDLGVNCTKVTVPAALQPLIVAREQYGADLVSLVRTFQSPENGSCGIAWLLGARQMAIPSASSSFAFSVVSDSGGTQYPDNGTCREEYLAHELGHNMGLQHDRATAQGSDDTNSDGILLDPEEYGRYPYSFGYKSGSTADDFYTIMALRGTGQSGYNVFSNPRITFCGGSPCGVVNQADDARALGLTLPLVAGFRVPATPLGNTWLRGDFNGDGKRDILWRNSSTGANVIWRSALASAQQPITTVASQEWRVVGASDFDGDGKSDLLWRNSVTGGNVLWKSASPAAQQTLAAVNDQSWAIVGAGDFNNDGKSDILWRNGSTGANVIWRSALSSSQQAVAPVANLAWRVVGVGDFDGDHRSDILWRNSVTGQNGIWKSGNSATSQALTPVVNLAWRVVGVADFDGDGKSDILWRSGVTGQNAIWKSGNSATPQAVTSVIDVKWVVVGVGDFDGDGKADILWRNFGTGSDVMWKSASSATQQQLIPVTDPNWMISA